MVEMIQKYLKDEIELEYGKGLTSNQRRDGKIPVYGSNGIVDYNDKFYFEGPGIIIGRKGTVGSVKYEENNFWAIDTTYVVKLKNKNEDLIFWYYFLQTLGLERMNSHSAVPGLNRDRVYNIKINIPKKQEDRKRISIILRDLDKKIELNNQINDNLYEIIKIQYNNFMYELTEYKLVKLKDIANICSGKRPKVKGIEYEIPLIGASGIMSYTDSNNFDEDIIIIGRVGTLGVVQRYFNKIWASDNTLTIRTKFKNVVENYLKTVDYISLNRGSTQPLITQTDIGNLEIKFNQKEFEKFENTIKVIRDKIYQNELQNKILEQLRDTLLPRLMNGEIDIDNIEN